ncbi:DUF4124 domain-containing protein [Acinetobacter sp. KS-LM10]|uniref:DUF4124 domain-containing protein n=1 Tax=Acinetobacter sp. KS-LM10 TaxID=3120518 RepID=UPI0030D3246D
MNQYNPLKSIALYVILTSTAIFTANQTFAKEYYKWVDSNGSTHYTATPPPKAAKKKGKVETYGWQGQPAATQTPVNVNPQQSKESQNPSGQSPTQPTTHASTRGNVSEIDSQQREANEALQRK